MNRCIIRGPKACFARVEQPDKTSYPIITPNATCRVVTRIFDHPGLMPDIKRIMVLNPILYANIGRVFPTEFATYKKGTLTLKASKKMTTVETVLLDPKWLIEFEWKPWPKQRFEFPKQKWRNSPDSAFENVNLAKATAIFGKRVDRGEFYYPPCLGQSHYRALVEPCRGNEKPISSSRDFGQVLLGIDYRVRPVIPYFFDAKMIDGVIEVPSFHEILKEAS